MSRIRLKLWRVIVLACAAVVVFFIGQTIQEKYSTSTRPTSDFKVQPLSQGFSLSNSLTTQSDANKLSSYPPPESFRRFYISEKTLTISASCKDQYYVVLVFEEKVDYRKNPRAAQYNRAFPCPSDKNFSLVIDSSELEGNGAYYYLVADENENEEWYNPR